MPPSPVTSRGPVVRVDVGPWCRWIDLSGGARRMGRVTFDAEVRWVRETTTRWAVTYGDGSRGPTGSTHCDFGRFASSMDEVVDQARRQAGLMGAGPGGRVLVEVVCVVEDRPLLPDGERSGVFGATAYLTIPDGWVPADDPVLARREREPDARIDESPGYVGTRSSGPLVLWSSTVAEGSPEAAALFDAGWAVIVEGLPGEARRAADEGIAAWRAAGMRSG